MAGVREIRREFRILLECSRSSLDEDAKERLRDYCEKPVDWPLLLEWAQWHHVTPLVFHAMKQASIETLSIEVFAQLKLGYEQNRRNAESLIAELFGILKTLDIENVVAVPFKGPTAGALLYGDPALRVASDLDFLLAEHDISRALAALEPMGYHLHSRLTEAQERIFRKGSNQYQLVRDDGKVTIELHWAIAQPVLAVEFDYPGLWKRLSTVNLGEGSVPIFSDRDLLIVLCIHGFKEQWARLKWICDIAELLNGRPQIDWSALYRQAESTGTVRMLSLGLLLANQYLRAPVPGDVLVRAKMDNWAPRLADEASNWLFFHRVASPMLWTPDRFRWRMRERLSDRLRYVLRTLLTPKRVHLEMVSLPDSMLWAYYPIRWLHDYLLWPVWMLMKRLRRT